MGKTLTYKSGYNTSDIINNSDVGSLTDNEDNETIDATNVNTTDVRNVLNEDTNNIGKLCTSPNINKWALYKPGKLKVENNNLIYSESNTYKLGDFLGYNHNAKKPEIQDTEQPYYEDDTTITIFVVYNQYELNWDEIKNVTHFWIRCLEDETERKKFSEQIDYSDRNQNLDFDLDVSQDSGDKTLNIELYVGNSTEELAIVDSATLTLNYKELTKFDGILYNAGSGYIPNWDDESIDANNDTFTIDIYLYNSSMNRVSETVNIDVYKNGSLDHTKTNVFLNANDTNGTTITSTFQNGINEYDDEWSLVLT